MRLLVRNEEGERVQKAPELSRGDSRKPTGTALRFGAPAITMSTRSNHPRTCPMRPPVMLCPVTVWPWRRLQRWCVAAFVVILCAEAASSVHAESSDAPACSCACWDNCGLNCCCAKSVPKPTTPRGGEQRLETKHLREATGGGSSSRGAGQTVLSECPRNCPGQPVASVSSPWLPATDLTGPSIHSLSLAGRLSDWPNPLREGPIPLGLFRPPRG
jgi:hypothetical protein